MGKLHAAVILYQPGSSKVCHVTHWQSWRRTRRMVLDGSAGTGEGGALSAAATSRHRDSTARGGKAGAILLARAGANSRNLASTNFCDTERMHEDETYVRHVAGAGQGWTSKYAGSPKASQRTSTRCLKGSSSAGKAATASSMLLFCCD